MKIESRPWTPQDLLDDLQSIIDEESDNYLNTRRTTLEMALAYLKEHFDEPKWIPVALGFLPEKGGEYLCRCIVDDYDDMPFCMVLRYYSVDKHPHFQHEQKCGMKVTHWMPIPNPPGREVQH